MPDKYLHWQFHKQAHGRVGQVSQCEKCSRNVGSFCSRGGPIFAIPKLLKNADLCIDDIGLWELNEAFACQVLYCRDHLGIDPEIYNVNGGAISIGHPYGMTGARQVGHALLEGKRRGVKYVVTSMCVGGGMGAAALFEIA